MKKMKKIIVALLIAVMILGAYITVAEARNWSERLSHTLNANQTSWRSVSGNSTSLKSSNTAEWELEHITRTMSSRPHTRTRRSGGDRAITGSNIRVPLSQNNRVTLTARSTLLRNQTGRLQIRASSAQVTNNRSIALRFNVR